MEAVLHEQALDIFKGTFQDVVKRQPFMTWVYTNYGLLNSLWNGRMKLGGGKYIERPITLKDEQNAKHRGNWEEDTHNVVNINENIRADWVTASSNVSYNVIEQSENQGAAQIYDVIESKVNNMYRELADEMLETCITTPTSASDKNTPKGLFGWVTYGTNGSTGGWTGYKARYNDGNGTSAATFNVGGIDCSSTVNPRWANYYADHDGDLDESLLVLLDRATRKLNFEGPQNPKALDNTGVQAGKFSLYSNDNVIGTINLLYAKSDDQMGFRVGSHFGRPVFKDMTFQYVGLLDTANTSIFGTDPIVGVNHNIFYPVVLSDWDFKVGKPRQRDNQHLVYTIDVDVRYTYLMENRQFGAFLVSQRGA